MNASSSPTFGLNTNEVRRRHILGKALCVGITAGLVASAFRWALVAIEALRLRVVDGLGASGRVAFSIAFATAMGALAIWLVRRFCPEAAGSGIPHLKSVLLGERALRWLRVLIVKFIGGIAAIGGGMALGREGPTIQMGGATALGVAELLRVRPGEGERKALISAGAGAGLSAAFNAPLAGVIFVLEELQGSFTPVIFVAAFLASVSADVVARLLMGELPVLPLHAVSAPGVSALPLAAVVGAVAGFGGVAFNRCLLLSLDLQDRLKKLPSWALGASAGLIVGTIGGFFPRIVGSGNQLVEAAVTGSLVTRWILVLLGARFLLTLVSYGSGAAGGIFAPLLVLGSLGGLWLGQAAQHVVPVWIPHPEVFAVLGMGALFTATVRAPLTGIVLMVELTGEYGFMLPLLVSCLIAYGIAEGMRSEPIYEALRLRTQRLATPPPP